MQVVALCYVMLPAYFANMAAAFAKFWPGWNRPISRRWLGDHKTVVGFLLGVTAAVVTSYLQSQISWSPHGLQPSFWVALGCAQGIGAMFGGALLFGWPWLRLQPIEVALILGFTFAAHIATNHVAFHLGIRDARW